MQSSANSNVGGSSTFFYNQEEGFCQSAYMFKDVFDAGNRSKQSIRARIHGNNPSSATFMEDC